MSWNPAHIGELINKYNRGTLTPEEELALQTWAGSDSAHRALVDELTEPVRLSTIYAEMDSYADGPGWDRIREHVTLATPVTSVVLMRRWWIRIAAAAVISVAIGTGGWFYLVRNKPAQTEVVNAKPADIPAPTATRATITLANGQKVIIDSVGAGQLAQEGTVQVVKGAYGEIRYTPGNAGTVLAFNTLSNPRGSAVVRLTLSDGTRVWLNAESSIRYPVAFAGNTRNVTITGEAYFDVTHEAGRPFFVSKGGVTVQVLGTDFNISAYDDEPSMTITLLDGAVRVSSSDGQPGGSGQGILLKPGQQAIIGGGTQRGQPADVLSKVDTQRVMAWKEGFFEFSNLELPAVMRQLSRWYDVHVQYQGTPNHQTFGGRISRSLPLSKILELLHRSGVVCHLDDRHLIVQP